MSRPVLVLVGPPGAGKTTVGRLAADRLGVAFRDTDADVEQQTGSTISDLFVSAGEEHFRARERAAVAAALETHDGVLSLGGGAVTDEQTRALLTGHHVVFLNVGLGDAFTRTGMNRDRPLLAINPRAVLREMLAARLPLYREVAQREVLTDGKTPDDVLEEVLA
ncbi:MAG: shikimate kinase [Frankiales bacterium]|nr:shikimate kinase [Frankiales bacterium]